MRLTPEDIEALTSDPVKHVLGTPSLYEIAHAITLLRKRHWFECFVLKRRLKWLVRQMDKHYDVKWTTPWDRK